MSFRQSLLKLLHIEREQVGFGRASIGQPIQHGAERDKEVESDIGDHVVEEIRRLADKLRLTGRVVALGERKQVVKFFLRAVEGDLPDGAFLFFAGVKVQRAEGIVLNIQIVEVAGTGVGELHPLQKTGVAEGVGIDPHHAPFVQGVGLIRLGGGVVDQIVAVAGVQHAVLGLKLRVALFHLKALQILQIGEGLPEDVGGVDVEMVLAPEFRVLFGGLADGEVFQLAGFWNIDRLHAGGDGLDPFIKGEFVVDGYRVAVVVDGQGAGGRVEDEGGIGIGVVVGGVNALVHVDVGVVAVSGGQRGQGAHQQQTGGKQNG